MEKAIISNQQLEKDSIKVFERLLQDYTNAITSGAREGREKELIEQLTFLPTLHLNKNY